MKAVIRYLKKYWITVWLVMAGMLLGTFISYAIYTEVSTIKRVVTTESAPKELFSSNCMYADLYERRMPATEFHVNVNNFDINSPEIPNPAQIQYTLTAELQVKYQGTIMSFSELQAALNDNIAYNEIVARAGGYKIGKSQENNTAGIIVSPDMKEFSADNNFRVVFNGPTTTGETTVNYETLPGGSVSTDRFKVTIPQSAFNNPTPEFYVHIKAEPTDTGLKSIQTRLYGSQNVIVTAAWSGTLAESNTATLDYDFYNYVITGSGSGKLDIMWDPAYFDIDDFFFNSSLSGVTFDNNNSTPVTTSVTINDVTHNNWKKVTIAVDSTNGKSRYELQLYKKKANTPYIDANDAANYIYCKMQ